MSDQPAAKMKVWTVGAKVPNLDSEVAFIQALGGSLVLDEVLTVDDHPIRLVLMQWGDKHLHLFGEAVYEARLGKEVPYGLCHIVFQVGDFEARRQRALDAGAREIMPPQFVSAGFGTRDVSFMQSPGGILFELIRIHENRVPDLNAGTAIEGK